MLRRCKQEEKTELRQKRGRRQAGRRVFTLGNAREWDEEGVDVNSCRKKTEQWENGDGKQLGLRGLASTDQCYPQLHLHRGSIPPLVPNPYDEAPSELLIHTKRAAEHMKTNGR